MLNKYFYTLRILMFTLVFLSFSCKDLLEIPEPKDTLTTVKVFTNDAQAIGAMAGVLSKMINGNGTFSSGLATRFYGCSADEFSRIIIEGDKDRFGTNSLIATDSPVQLWSTAYEAIYGANAIIEGIAASKSQSLHAKIRTELSAEAKFIRAFNYFYLINTFGDVPLVLTTDFNQTVNLSRAEIATVYKQIVLDLIEAANGLPADYAAGGGERIRANKWAAKALLARVYLFIGNNAGAVKEANDVVSQTALYQIETTDLNNVFLKNSAEAIWQLQQNTQVSGQGTATPEALVFLPNPLHTGGPGVDLSSFLLNAFEPGDLRKVAWVGSTVFPENGPTYLFPYKYKTGRHNMTPGGVSTEYYMVLRLAEQYLIHAEASALDGDLATAINDLNVLRRRAGLGDLSRTLSKDQVLAAVAKERQTELFAEWGHRWLDLKRTGKAREVLSAIPMKQPWRGDYQLLYPIPPEEILKDHFLIQNPNY